MTNEQSAILSNYWLYAAMACFTVAMVAYAAYLGTARSGRGAAAPAAAPHRELVTAGPAGPADAAPGEAPGQAAGAPRGPAPGSRAGGAASMLSWLGTMALAVSIGLRWLAAGRAPVSSMFEFAVAAAFGIMLIFLALGLKYPLKWLGVFVVTPVLLILGLAITAWYSAAGELVPSLKSVWLVIHVPVAILATALFTMAFIMLLLHLVTARYETRDAAAGKGVRSGVLAALPGPDALDRASYALHIAAFPLWTFSIIAGAIWGQQAWGTYWNWDPKEVWTFVIWVIYAAYLHARATSGWSPRRASVIAITGYAAIVVNFTIVNIFLPGMHSYSGL